ncbi:MAG: hypothetical protein HDS58_05485 [Barnesiella sp.]|nr:hypothetical protein [Barnesiella sp.]
MNSALKEYPKRNNAGKIIIGVCVLILLAAGGIFLFNNSTGSDHPDPQGVSAYYKRKATQAAWQMNRMVELKNLSDKLDNISFYYHVAAMEYLQVLKNNDKPQYKPSRKPQYYDYDDDDEEDDDDDFDEKWDYGYGEDYDEYGEPKY